MDPVKLVHECLDFVNCLRLWESALPSAAYKEICRRPDEVAVISVDMINAFCRQGVLASPRIQNIIKPCAGLLKNLRKHNVKNFIFTQDYHLENSPEFNNFPPHAVKGSAEAEMIREFKNLPFSRLFKIVPKKSINSFIGTKLDNALTKIKKLKTIIVIGNCTDLCVYHLAAHLKLKANAEGLPWKIIVPANCVQTYDITVNDASKIKAFAHPGDMFHYLFLYHMHLNGVAVVKEIK